MVSWITREVTCKSGFTPCGFPGGGWAINPYVGCSHGCRYCSARLMKKITEHWGTFVDVRTNIVEAVAGKLKSSKFVSRQIYLGTVTDPYQPAESHYQLTKNLLKVLLDYKHPVSILTKSDLAVRDIDMFRRMQAVDVNFTINTLDEKWKGLAEPHSPTIKQRFQAMKNLTEAGIIVGAMVGPYFPFFTDSEGLFRKFKTVGVSHVLSESFNTTGGNWIGVDAVLKKRYPH